MNQKAYTTKFTAALFIIEKTENNQMSIHTEMNKL